MNIWSLIKWLCQYLMFIYICHKAWTLVHIIPFGDHAVFPPTLHKWISLLLHMTFVHILCLTCNFNEITRICDPVFQNMIWITRMWRFLPHSPCVLHASDPIFCLVRCSVWTLEHAPWTSFQDLEQLLPLVAIMILLLFNVHDAIQNCTETSTLLVDEPTKHLVVEDVSENV